MYYVYLLQSDKDGTTYIGYTEDLRKRFKEHNQGKTRSLKNKLPMKLIYYEAYLTKTDARIRELELKNNSQQKEQLLRRVRLVVRTPGFHPGNRGSIPLRGTRNS